MHEWRTTTRKRAIGVALVVAAAIGTLLAVFAAPGHTGTSTPQGPATFVALANGTPIASASLPADVKTFISSVVSATGGNAATLSGQVYLLRSSLGPKGLDFYGFVDGTGRPCFVVPDESAACGSSSQTPTPGFYWNIGGGNGGTEPSYLFGFADDSVQSIDLTVDGNDVPVRIDNNAAYASYPNTAKAATVTVHYTNGSTSSDSLSLGPAGSSG